MINLQELEIGAAEVSLASLVVAWLIREGLAYLKKKGVDLPKVSEDTADTNETVHKTHAELETLHEFITDETKNLKEAQSQIKDLLANYKETIEEINKAIESGDISHLKMVIESTEKSLDKSITTVEKQMDKLININDAQANIFQKLLLEMNTMSSSLSSLHKRFDEFLK